MRRLICGKFDSRWKFDWDLKTNRQTRRLVQGYFMSGMAYARYTQGGVDMIQSVRDKPWNTWRAR